MAMDRLRKLLSSDKMVMSAWTGQQDPLYMAALAETDFDVIIIDMQHGMATESSVISTIATVAPTGKPVMVRVPVGRFDFVSKALDAGAHGIIAPMINTVEDAKQLASFGKYIPLGDRSFGPGYTISVLNTTIPEYVASANRDTVILPMIETQQAFDNLDAILDVEGIDGFFLGPGDLSISVRQNPMPDAYGEATIDLIKAMKAASEKRGKLSTGWCGTTAQAEIANEIGFSLASLGSDGAYINQGANTMLKSLSFT